MIFLQKLNFCYLVGYPHLKLASALSAAVLDQTCILFADCPEIEENPQFTSGQKECDVGNGE